MSHDRHFGHLRSLLHAAPDEATWRRICRIIERADADRAADQLIPYADTVLDQRWPDHLRVAHNGWVRDAARTGEPPRCWPIVRALHSCPEPATTARLDAGDLLGHIRHVALHDATPSDHLRALLDARSLQLTTFQHTTQRADGDAYAPLFTRHPALRALTIAPWRHTEPGLHLTSPPALHALHALDIARCQLTPDAELALLRADMPALRELSIALCGANPAALRLNTLVGALDTLRLTLRDAGAAHALAPLGNAPQLQHLTLRGALTPDAIELLHATPLAHPPAQLTLSHAPLHEDAYAALARLPLLRESAQITLRNVLQQHVNAPPAGLDALMDAMRGAASLGLVHAHTTGLGDALCRAPWPHLTALHINTCIITLPTTMFASLPALTSLHLWRLRGLADHVRALCDAPRFEHLTDISLLNSWLPHDAIGHLIRALDGHPRLQHLNLTYTSATTAHLAQLAACSLPALRTLSMLHTQGVPGVDALDALCRAPWLAQLTDLRVSQLGAADMTHQRARLLAAGLPPSALSAQHEHADPSSDH